jgi:hypothetical protein
MKKFLWLFPSFLMLLYSLLFLLGCEKPPEAYQAEPNVVCLLRTDQDAVSALVGMSAGFTDTLKNPAQWNGVSGATVKIDDVFLRERKDSVGYYTTGSLKAAGGKTYSLEVTYPDEKAVKGTTVVPDSFALIALKIDTVIDTIIYIFPPLIDTVIEEMARVAFHWGKSQNCRSYLLGGTGSYTNGNDTMSYPIGPALQDSTSDSLDFPLEIGGKFGETFKLAEAKISVWAVDENYYDYYTYQWGMFFDINADIPMHLDGGLGVFGSAFVVERRITFP